MRVVHDKLGKPVNPWRIDPMHLVGQRAGLELRLLGQPLSLVDRAAPGSGVALFSDSIVVIGLSFLLPPTLDSEGPYAMRVVHDKLGKPVNPLEDRPHAPRALAFWVSLNALYLLTSVEGPHATRVHKRENCEKC